MAEVDYALEVKALTDEGEIEGLAVGYGNLDHGGDVVAPGAITASVAGRKSLPMLLFHDHKRPIGVWTDFKEVSEGLIVKGRFDDTLDGREARARARSGSLGGLSMGFKAIRHRFEGKARHLLEVALHEISLVTIPMNDRTRVLSAKDILQGGGTLTERELETHFREELGFSKSNAVAMASACKSYLRGDPEVRTDDTAAFWRSLGG